MDDKESRMDLKDRQKQAEDSEKFHKSSRIMQP